MASTYRILPFTEDTWARFLRVGGKIAGFPDSTQGRQVTRLPVGTILLAYIKKAEEFVGAYEIVSEARYDLQGPWGASYPWCVDLQPVVELSREQAPTRQDLVPHLDLLKPQLDAVGRDNWGAAVRGSLRSWRVADAEALLAQLEQWRKRAPHIDHSAVTTPHVEMQGLLMQLGHALGYGVHPAKGDGRRLFRGVPLARMPGAVTDTPSWWPIDARTRGEVARVDVLWLNDRDYIYAAFEVENSTKVLPGLTRMSEINRFQPHVPKIILAPTQTEVQAVLNKPLFQERRGEYRYQDYPHFKHEVGSLTPATIELLKQRPLDYLERITLAAA